MSLSFDDDDLSRRRIDEQHSPGTDEWRTDKLSVMDVLKLESAELEGEKDMMKLSGWDFIPQALFIQECDPILQPFVARALKAMEHLCWFRTLGENPTMEAHLPPPPLRQETDVVPLELAKNNVSDLYKPLKNWQTRIITVLPASSEPLQCKLWTADLMAWRGVAVSGTPDIVTYNALSYSWGSGSPTGRVICNNVKVLVNDTLASALRVLRDQHKEIHIWCDVLCINQSDPVEKAQQVRNMLRIFENAERVIAWIGLPDRWTMPLFHVLSDKEDSSKDPSCSPHAAITYGLTRGGWRHDPECLKNVSEIVRAAGEHLRRPWFRRTWVRQEVFGTSNLTIYCGGETTSLSNFITATQRIFDFEQRLLSNPLQADIPPPLDQHQRNVSKSLSSLIPASVFVLQESYEHASTDRHDYRQPRQRLRYSAHWLRVLNGGGDFEATDPRDKVYGVLGIITSRTTRWYVEIPPNIQNTEFPISYTKSVSEVYEDVVKHLVNVDRNLDALQVFEDRCQRAEDLSSWVTDWRQNIRRSIVRCAPDNKFERDRIGQAPIQDRNDVGKLRLEGVQVGGPLNGINMSKRMWKAPTFPEPERMDSNYEEMISSDCFVWGTFLLDRSLLVGDLRDVLELDWEGLQGYHILVPRAAKPGDILVAVLGSSTLFLLRPRLHGEYKFLGPVIRGNGDLPDWSRVEMQTFVLV